MFISNYYLVAFFVVFVITFILLLVQISKKSKVIILLQNKNIEEKHRNEALSAEIDRLTTKYSSIISIEIELDKIKNQITNLENEKNSIISSNQAMRSELESKYKNALVIYEKLSKEINIIEDKLETYSYGLYNPHYDFNTSEEYKNKLEGLLEKTKQTIKNERAIVCKIEWTVNNSKVEGRKMTKHYSKIMLRAFNSECDTSILKVKWNNIKNMEERINKSFEAINKLGETHQIEITREYLKQRLEELYLTYEYEEKKYQEKEEQKRIREQMREEEKVRKEIETKKIEAEKEENIYQKAIEKAQKELEKKHGDEKVEFENKIVELEAKLKEAREEKERAISMAQQTKAGHVYIISNIGSFGENIFKVGMTRRLEPEDRVRELGGASVPFAFDIHAMIFSDNAPELENKFHKKFTYNRLNLINQRKEFFNVTLDQLEAFAKENKCEIEFTKLAEAKDYRQTQQIREKKSKEEIENEIANNYPDNIFEEDEQEEMEENLTTAST